MPKMFVIRTLLTKTNGVLSSILTAMVAVFFMVQLLMYLPLRNSAIRTSRLRSLLQEDSIQSSHLDNIPAVLRHIPIPPKISESIASPRDIDDFDSILLKKFEASLNPDFKLSSEPGGSVLLKQNPSQPLMTPGKGGALVLPMKISSAAKTASTATSPQTHLVTAPQSVKNGSFKPVEIKLARKLIPKRVRNEDVNTILDKSHPRNKAKQTAIEEGSYDMTKGKTTNQTSLESNSNKMEGKTTNQTSVEGSSDKTESKATNQTSLEGSSNKMEGKTTNQTSVEGSSDKTESKATNQTSLAGSSNKMEGKTTNQTSVEGSSDKTESKATNRISLEGSSDKMEGKTTNQTSLEDLQSLLGRKDTKQPAVPSVNNYRLQPQANRWIVLDGGKQPCSDVTVYTVGQPGWHVMLFNNGDVAVKGCSPELCQVQHMTDLNQAYLKVISYGADIIVLADCLARYPQLDQDFRLNDLHQYGMYYNATNMFNPYHHAGYEAVFPKVNSAWERAINSPIDGGSPLTHPKPNSKMYFLSDFGRVSFRQGFRLGEDICACKDASSFDPKGEELLDNPVVVGDNTLVHLGTGPSVALPDAFYWLFAPRGLSGDALESFRTFWLHALKKAGLIHTGYFQTNALLASPGGDSSKSLNQKKENGRKKKHLQNLSKHIN